MMPPHVETTEPPDGGVLEGDTVVFYGWSFGFFPDEPVLAVDADGCPIDVERRLVGECVGDGDTPGSRQYRSKLVGRLMGVVPGGTYRVRFLDAEIRLRAAD